MTSDRIATVTFGLCGIILAAGESARMGRDKALLPWPPAPAPQQAGTGNENFLTAAISSITPFCEAVLVVAGKNYAAIAPAAAASGATPVRNPAPERGQFSSLQTGLSEALKRGYRRAMITLVDRPPVGRATLEALCSRFREAVATGKWGVAPEHNRQHGHPLLATRELMEIFLEAPLSSNAREIKHANASRIEYVTVDDPLAAANVNTPEEYAALLRFYSEGPR